MIFGKPHGLSYIVGIEKIKPFSEIDRDRAPHADLRFVFSTQIF